MQYDGHDGYKGLQDVLEARESGCASAAIGRLFYLALPPSVYPQVRSHRTLTLALASASHARKLSCMYLIQATLAFWLEMQGLKDKFDSLECLLFIWGVTEDCIGA